MLLDLRCPSCGYTQRASDAVFGKTILCPSCGGIFPVARPPASVEPARLPCRPDPRRWTRPRSGRAERDPGG